MTDNELQTYSIRTWGCQMNEADSERVASELERFGLRYTNDMDSADIIILNTCVVRQSAEDRVYGRLGQLKTLKRQYPYKVIGLMGCLVGVKDALPLRQRFPFIDVFMAPSDPSHMVQFLEDRGMQRLVADAEEEGREIRDAIQDGDLLMPSNEQAQRVSAYIPVVYGCSHACSFCVIPFRRGIERSRSVGEIAAEARALTSYGVKEVTLLGQIVDRYGKDIPDGPDLADLLRVIHNIDGLERIRFLTSHPNWMTDKLLDAVAELPKVCEHIEVPIQAGDDETLRRMKRGYTQAEYRHLIDRIRKRIPVVAIHTDIIVGFPGETESQFQQTFDVLADLRLDKAHVAMYSPRPNTVSSRSLPDDVAPEEKKRRLHVIDDLQATIVADINRRHLGQSLEVLIEDYHVGKWRGRTRLNKLVFFEDERDWRGKLVNVEIVWTGPWSMQGRLLEAGMQPNIDIPRRAIR
jgi:tRNA-2-methylthio-N6-dimethylallyladenosine synthase